MDKNWMEKIKGAASSEEILEICKENNYPLEEKEAEELFEQLHTEGELSDEELDSVSGGGCSVKVGGVKYTTVTNNCKCFNGGYFPGYDVLHPSSHNTSYGDCKRNDNLFLRDTWTMGIGCTDTMVCGNCFHLEFKGGIGYCGKSGR